MRVAEFLAACGGAAEPPSTRARGASGKLLDVVMGVRSLQCPVGEATQITQAPTVI